MRQLSIADITFNWPRLTWPALALRQAGPIKYKAALSVAYGAGLRVSEVVSLKVSDVNSERMMLRVEQGKGRLDRPEIVKHLSSMHQPRKMPFVLSPEEVARFLEAAPGRRTAAPRRWR